MSKIRFAIDETLPTLNVLLRLHWSKRQRIARRVQQLVWVELRKQGLLPMVPMQRARIQVRRFSSNEPDPDGMPSTAKLLLDVLQPMSKRHPLGLGVIVNDDSDSITLHVEHVPKRVARTEVEIEAL